MANVILNADDAAFLSVLPLPKDEKLAEAIEGMILRDCRKLASDKADSLEHAAQLLQHSSKSTTSRHYRTEIDRIKPVR